VKRFIASIGLLLLTCQIALGSAGSLFLCLCAAHETPCAPPATVAEAENCCAHVEEESAANEDECTDLLITTDEIDTIEFNKDSSRFHFSLLLTPYQLPDLHNPAFLFERPLQPAQEPPRALSPRRLYTQTIKLLL